MTAARRSCSPHISFRPYLNPGRWHRVGLLALLLGAALSASAHAQYSTTTSNGQITITRYTGPNSGNVVVPATIGGLPVIAVGGPTSGGGGNAFSGETGIQSIVIPEGVTTIGPGAFASCEGLTSVTLPSTVTSIGVGAFEYCYDLTTITLPPHITVIPQEMFYNSGIQSVVIPNGVTSVGDYAFQSADIRNLVFPDSVTYLGFECFYLSSLNSIVLGQGITTITADAFAGCVNLDSVSMSNSVTAIDGSAFAGCHSLANITIPASVTTIADDAFANAGVLSATFNGNAPTVGTSIFVARTGFTVKFYAGATGFGDPIWLTSSNETYPATTLAATQSISFPAIPTQVYPGTGTVPLSASATSGLPITYSVVSGPATISANTLSLTSTGTVVVRATQPGDNNNGAVSATQSFTVVTGTDINGWLSLHSTTGNPGDITHADGVPNLLKYLFNIDPRTNVSPADRAAFPVISLNTINGIDYVALTYRKYALATGLTISLQTSTDLRSWATVTPAYVSQISTDTVTGDPIIQMGVPVATPSQFVRLQVSMP